MENLTQKNYKSNFGYSPIETKSMPEWIEEGLQQPPIPFVLENIIYEEELFILVGEANVGKSLSLIQLADAISKGSTWCSILTNKYNVLYHDCEMNTRQITHRYTNTTRTPYNFSNNFFRSVMSTDYSNENFIYDFLLEVSKLIINEDIKVILIDNLSSIFPDFERAVDAKVFMNQLRNLKNKFQVTIIIAAHTPKTKDPTREFSLDNIEGSKQVSNAIDSAGCLVNSRTNSEVIYFKQLKVRNEGFVYSNERVLLLRKTKSDNFLKLEKIGESTEREQLSRENDRENENLKKKILGNSIKLDISNVQLSKLFGVSEGTIRNWKESFKND